MSLSHSSNYGVTLLGSNSVYQCRSGSVVWRNLRQLLFQYEILYLNYGSGLIAIVVYTSTIEPLCPSNVASRLGRI